MGAWAKAQDIDDNDKRFSERYVARQDSKVTMLADARRYPCEINQCLGFPRADWSRRCRRSYPWRNRHATPPSNRFIAGCELAKALDLVLDHPNNLHDLGGPRMKRFAAFYDDGVLMSLSVAEGPKGADGLHSDPAGDDAPESTFAENFLKTI